MSIVCAFAPLDTDQALAFSMLHTLGYVQVFAYQLKACCVSQAGSDSLLTSSAFVKLASSRFKGFEQLQGHKGVLFGLGVDGNNEMVLTDH